MNLAEYKSCLRRARRYARNEADAGDLLHDALLAAARVGRLEFASPEDIAWLSGVLRNLAAGSARREIRRRRREARWTDAVTADNGLHVPSDGADAKFLKHLSESTRRVAVLALHGLNADEIQYVLGLKPPAFRQRLVTLRKALGEFPVSLQQEALAAAYARRERGTDAVLDFGLIRRALLHHLRVQGGVGTHDPDGHLLNVTLR